MSADLLGGAAAAPPGPPILTVSQLNSRVKALLEGEFREVLVEGEISSWRTYPSGHAYFALKDAASKVGAVMFSGRRRLLRFAPEDGMRVMVRARVTLYERDGRFQLSVLSIEPLGEGALEIAFRQLLKKLEEEGLFAPGRKQPLPGRPRRVALVTSREGAALRDMLHVFRERAPIVELIVIHTRVQGEGAASSIAAAIRRADTGLAALGKPADLIICGRGGGSREDLWAFNEEEAVRAIAACRVPVLSAVGHEVDRSLCDLAADESAATPTAAAERAARGWQALSRDLNRMPEVLESLASAHVEGGVDTVRAILADRIFRRPGDLIDAMGQRLDGDFERLGREVRHALERQGVHLRALTPRLLASSPRSALRQGARRVREVMHRLSGAAARSTARQEAGLRAAVGRLEAISPLAVLGRGYALAYREPDGALLRDASAVKTGGQVRIRLSRGELMVRVEEVLKDEEMR